ncbi:hypothetical protein VPH35_007851 [Triticum aestivum]
MKTKKTMANRAATQPAGPPAHLRPLAYMACRAQTLDRPTPATPTRTHSFPLVPLLPLILPQSRSGQPPIPSPHRRLTPEPPPRSLSSLCSLLLRPSSPLLPSPTTCSPPCPASTGARLRHHCRAGVVAFAVSPRGPGEHACARGLPSPPHSFSVVLVPRLPKPLLCLTPAGPSGRRTSPAGSIRPPRALLRNDTRRLPATPSSTTVLTTRPSCQSNQMLESRSQTPPSTTTPTTSEVPTTCSPLTMTRSS